MNFRFPPVDFWISLTRTLFFLTMGVLLGACVGAATNEGHWSSGILLTLMWSGTATLVSFVIACWYYRS